MSSKSLGKSVNSVVKSVESLLPKGINLKHVLLGLLVGLLICMMFGQTVEGLGITMTGTVPRGSYTCPDGDDYSVYTVQGDESNLKDSTGGVITPVPGDVNNIYCGKRGNFGDRIVGSDPTPPATVEPTLNNQNTGGTGNNQPPASYPCILPDTVDSKYKLNNVSAGTQVTGVTSSPASNSSVTCNDPTLDSTSPAQISCPRSGQIISITGCSATPASSNDGCAAKPDSNYKPVGICMPSGVDSDNFYSRGCFANISEDACPTDGGCEWASTNEVDSSGTLNQEGLDLLLNFVGLKKYQCSGDSANLKSGFTEENLDEIKNTKLLPIMGIVKSGKVESVLSGTDLQTNLDRQLTTSKDWQKLQSPGSTTISDTSQVDANGEFKDLLYWLFKDDPDWGNKLKNETDPDQWASAISGSTKIPENLKDPLSDVVTACAQAWSDDKIKDIYPHNGGRPIIGLDPHAGAVCRNTPYKPRVEVINEWRLHIGEGCPDAVSTTDKKFVTGGEKYVCSPNQKTCSTASGESFTDRAVNAIDSQNPFSIDNRCSISSCRSDGQLCPTQYFADATGGVFDNLLNKGKNALNIV